MNYLSFTFRLSEKRGVVTLHNMNAYVSTLHVYITNHTEHSMQRGMNLLLENHLPLTGQVHP